MKPRYARLDPRHDGRMWAADLAINGEVANPRDAAFILTAVFPNIPPHAIREDGRSLIWIPVNVAQAVREGVDFGWTEMIDDPETGGMTAVSVFIPAQP